MSMRRVRKRSRGFDKGRLLTLLMAAVVTGVAVFLLLPEKTPRTPFQDVPGQEEPSHALSVVPVAPDGSSVPRPGASFPVASPSPSNGPGSGLYQTLYDAVDGQQRLVRFDGDGLTAEQLEEILEQICEQPEFFWLDGYTYYNAGAEYRVEFDWKYTDLSRRRAQVEQAGELALASVPEGAGDYETALALHDWLCDHVEYQYSPDGSDQDLYGALVNGRCVCAGYSAGYEYLLRRAGLQAETVRGSADNGGGVQSHAWTKVVLDGEIYYTDVTWDDQANHPDGHTYGWFAVTSARMASTHFADPELGAEMTPSFAVACNYHYRNGWVLEEFSTEGLAQILSAQTGDSLTVLAGSAEVYQQLLALLRDDQTMFPLLEQAGHPANRYTFSITQGALCLDLFPER